jgi:hypothetical protein
MAEEAAVDLATANARLAKMNLPAGNTLEVFHEGSPGVIRPEPVNGTIAGEQPAPKTRRTRSDAGKPRPPKPTAPQPAQASAAGFLSEEHIKKIGELAQAAADAALDRDRSAAHYTQRYEKAVDAFRDYLDSLRSVPHA